MVSSDWSDCGAMFSKQRLAYFFDHSDSFDVLAVFNGSDPSNSNRTCEYYIKAKRTNQALFTFVEFASS